jgi:DNA-binding Lrp family transcriptional regulator
MRASAYVLINVRAGKGKTVMDELSKLKSITDVEAVSGPYDVVVSVAASDFNEVGRLVIEKIQTIDGIEKTLTCNVINFEQ